MTAQVHRLHNDPSDHPTVVTSTLALAFGHLMNLAVPVVKQFRSDWYHDALWLAEWGSDPAPFFFVVRESGTLIGRDERLLLSQVGKAYKVTIALGDRNWWTMTIEEVTR